MSNPKKIAIVDRLVEIIKQSSHIVIIQFQKTKHATLEKLRQELKKNNTTLVVVKNSLFEKAINRLATGDKILANLRHTAFPLQGNSALISLKDDWSAGLKTFFNFAKTNDSLSFKIGLIEKNLYDQAGLSRLAQIPSRKELLATIIGSLRSPIIRTTYTLQYPVKKLMFILSQKSKQV